MRSKRRKKRAWSAALMRDEPQLPETEKSRMPASRATSHSAAVPTFPCTIDATLLPDSTIIVWSSC